ncbi:MAG: hypoxanthine phosphoribosyltransferase [Firmicutes bacterium]|nr:hypoxanthine phosphoribosyltransferase [Bacillota bacterium]
MDDILGEVLIDEETLRGRIAELGEQITRDYAAANTQELVVVGILRGSVVFLSDLIRHVHLPLTLDFMAVSSYTKGTRSSGTVHILKDLSNSIDGKDVLIVEDIVDTGLTLKNLTEILAARHPRSLRLCTLLDKPSRRTCDVMVDYRGFEVEDKFVVGFGLDFDEQYRHLPFVGVLKPEAYE